MRSKTTGSGGGSQCGTPVRKRDGFVEGRVGGWGWGWLSCAQRWRCTRGTNATGRLQKNEARGKQVPEVTGLGAEGGGDEGDGLAGKGVWRDGGTLFHVEQWGPPRFPALERELESGFVRKPTSSRFSLSASCFQRSVFHVEHWSPSPCGAVWLRDRRGVSRLALGSLFGG